MGSYLTGPRLLVECCHSMISDDQQDLLDSLDGIAYVVDRDLVLRAVSRSAWRKFAVDNDGASVADTRAVIGQPLELFVSGEEVWRLYCEHLEDLEQQGPAARSVFAFRCDSPDKRREMRMAISPLILRGQHSGWLFHSVIWEEVSRPPMGLFDYSDLMSRLASETSAPALRMCSICQNVVDPAGDSGTGEQWIDASEYYRRGGQEDVVITHGICPGCYERVKPSAATA